MPSWPKLLAGWVLAAMVALALAWGAVAQVRNQVIQPTIEIPTTLVAAASQVTSEDGGTSSTTIPVIRVEPGTGVGDGSSTTSQPDETTSIVTGTSSASSTTTSAPGSTTTTTPSITTTTTAASAETSTHTLVGGQVRISHSAGVVNFVSAIPQPGFSTEVEEDGPEEVRVRFRSESHHSDFRARWESGELRITSSEESED